MNKPLANWTPSDGIPSIVADHVANSTARLAYTHFPGKTAFDASDVGKILVQDDDQSTWTCVAFPPSSFGFIPHTAAKVTPTDMGGAVEGDVLRNVSAGVYALAQADSAAHSAGIAGVRCGSTLLTFSDFPVVNFDSAPSIGRPCYPSATTAGKLTSTAPNVASPVESPHLIAIEDKSVGLNYKARVAINYGVTSAISREQRITQDAIRLTGADPGSLQVLFDDFNKLGYASGNKTPTWGSQTGIIVSTTPSAVMMASGGTILLPNALPALQMTLQKWYFEIKVRLDGASGISCVMYRTGVGGAYETIGLTNDGIPSKYWYSSGDWNPQSQPPNGATHDMTKARVDWALDDLNAYS